MNEDDILRCSDELLAIADGISRGEIPEYEHRQWFTLGAFDLFLSKTRDEDAYEILQECCRRFSSLSSSGKSMSGFYFLLYQLACHAGTTEMPQEMPVIIEAGQELSGGLKRWYRSVCC